MAKKENNYDVRAVNYRKADGTNSDRKIIGISEPRDNLFAYEVTNMSAEKIAELQTFLRAQKEALNGKLLELGAEMKSFKPELTTYLDGPIS